MNPRMKTLLLMSALWSDEDENVLNIFRSVMGDRFKLVKLIVLFKQTSHYRSIFSEEWIQLYVDYDFFLLFRMTKTTFQKLVSVIFCERLIVKYTGGEEPISPEKSLLLTLWWLGKGEVLNSVADKFDVVPSTVLKYSEILIDRLVELAPKYISWPKPNEIIIIEEEFREICGYPGKVFSNSNIFVDITQNNRIRYYFPHEDYHLLGDKAYPLLSWLITPYKDYGNLQRRHHIHNTRHSRTRIKVEHTFGVLKPRWRIFYYINVNDVKKMVKIICACCVLHNFCYFNQDEWEPEENGKNDNGDDDEGNYYRVHDNQMGLVKRNNICELFV